MSDEADTPATEISASPATVVSAEDLFKPQPLPEPPAKEPEKEPEKESEDEAELIEPDDLVKPLPGNFPADKGKGNRTLDDYARLDWSLNNRELARQTGVTRQRIAQIRADLKERDERRKLAESESVIAGETRPTNANGSIPPTEAIPTAKPMPSPVNYRLMAETAFAMGTGILTMAVGPEWQPKVLTGPNGEKIEEKEAVIDALRAYFQHKQMQDLPPGYMLAFVCFSYAAVRFTEPNTRNKFKLTWTWVKVKVGGFFGGFFKRRNNVIQLHKHKQQEQKAVNEN